MSISRKHTYLSGSLARGDDVQDDFDNLITFVNELEANKLDATGGTVDNLTVGGSFTSQGTSIFNAGLIANNQPITANAGIVVAAGALEMGAQNINLSTGIINAGVINSSGTATLNALIVTLDSVFNGGVTFNDGATVPTAKVLTLTDLPVDNTDAANKLYVDTADATFITKTTVQNDITGAKRINAVWDWWTGTLGDPINKISPGYMLLDQSQGDDTDICEAGNTAEGVGFLVKAPSGADLNRRAYMDWESVTVGSDASVPTGTEYSRMFKNKITMHKASVDAFKFDASATTLLFEMQNSAAAVAFNILTTATLTMKLEGLPTSNPGGSDLVWNNSGVLNIT